MTETEPVFEIRLLTPADIPDCMRLKEQCGWNQLEADWERFLEWCPEGCFGADYEGRIVGTATALSYGRDLSWIGLVMVDPDFRRHGLGKRLTEAALTKARECRCVGLDATPMGQGIYERLGFLEAWMLKRTVIEALPALPAPGAAVTPLTAEDLPAAVALDREILGVERADLFAVLLRDDPACAWALREGGELRACCLGRAGSSFHYLGPVLAETTEQVWALLCAAGQGLAGQPVALDVPQAQLGWRNLLDEHGFAEQRSLVRMYFHGHAPETLRERLFGLAGGELG